MYIIKKTKEIVRWPLEHRVCLCAAEGQEGGAGKGSYTLTVRTRRKEEGLCDPRVLAKTICTSYG